MSWRAFVSRNVNELRFLACPTSASSAGVRAFYEGNYATIKKLNPRLPFIIRAAEGKDPYIIARYDFNQKKQVSVAGMSPEQVEREVEKLVKAGADQTRSAESTEPYELPTVVE